MFVLSKDCLGGNVFQKYLNGILQKMKVNWQMTNYLWQNTQKKYSQKKADIMQQRKL